MSLKKKEFLADPLYGLYLEQYQYKKPTSDTNNANVSDHTIRKHTNCIRRMMPEYFSQGFRSRGHPRNIQRRSILHALGRSNLT